MREEARGQHVLDYLAEAASSSVDGPWPGAGRSFVFRGGCRRLRSSGYGRLTARIVCQPDRIAYEGRRRRTKRVDDRVVGGWTDILRAYVRRRLVLCRFVVIVFVAGLATGGLRFSLSPTKGAQRWWRKCSPCCASSTARPAAAPADVLKVALGEYVLKVPFVIGLLGLSVIGAPVVLAVIFVRGFVLGFTTMFLIDGLFFRGVVLAAAALLPQNLLAVPATVIAGIAGAQFFDGGGTSAAGTAGHQHVSAVCQRCRRAASECRDVDRRSFYRGVRISGVNEHRIPIFHVEVRAVYVISLRAWRRKLGPVCARSSSLPSCYGRCFPCTDGSRRLCR